MKTTFKLSTANWGCYAPTGKQHNYIKVEDFTIADFLDTDIVLKDKAWFIQHNCELTDKQFREFAIGCALVVLSIYEEIYPNNNAPRKAIEAAQKYLDGEIGLDELRIARNDAAAAYATSTSAAAATYAAYAAYDADAATYAASAAYAAASAACGKPIYRQALLKFFKDFVK